MNTFRSLYIDEAADTRAAWMDYGKFLTKLMGKIKAGTKNYIVMAHCGDENNEEDGTVESKVLIQGAIGKAGLSGHFTTVLEAISKPVNKRLKGMQNELMIITAKEDMIGIKYLFLTRAMKGHLSSLARSADDLWEDDELYIDNSIQNVINRLQEYYK